MFFMPFVSTYFGQLVFNGVDTEQIDAFSSGATAYELFGYECRQNTGSSTTTITASPENGTTFFETVVNLVLNKLTVKDQKELRILTYGRVIVFVLDNNDNLWSLGWEAGCDVVGGTMASGTAKGDMSGYTIDIRAQDKNMPYFLIRTSGSNEAKYPFDNLTNVASITVNNS